MAMNPDLEFRPCCRHRLFVLYVQVLSYIGRGFTLNPFPAIIPVWKISASESKEARGPNQRMLKLLLCSVAPLLGNDCEISKYVTASQRNMFPWQQLELQQWGTVFSVRSMSRCYKRDKLGAAVSQSVSELENCWGSVVVSYCCEKLVAETRTVRKHRRKRTSAV
jgi:hypothetical protein